MRYAVLAFGDSNYDDFCGHGRRLDERLAELGAHPADPASTASRTTTSAAGAWLEQVIGADTAQPPAPTASDAPAARVRRRPAVPSGTAPTRRVR